MLGASRSDSRKNRPVKPLFSLHGVSMDSLHAIGFYASSAVSLAGALGVALLAGRGLRGVSMAGGGVGVGRVFVCLLAGLGAGGAGGCYSGSAVFWGSPPDPLAPN